MKHFLIILCLWTATHAQSPASWWVDADSNQKAVVLWYAKHYGVSIGTKTVLETSGGKYTNHGEDSEGDLGLYFPGIREEYPNISEKKLRHRLKHDRHFQGKEAKRIDDANLYHMRHKRNPKLCAAMVYPGWRNWNNKRRLNRGLLDLKWQKFLSQKIK